MTAIGGAKRSPCATAVNAGLPPRAVGGIRTRNGTVRPKRDIEPSRPATGDDEYG